MTTFIFWKSPLFSTVELNLLLDLKLGLSDVGLRVYYKLFPNSQKDWKLAFADVAVVWLLVLSDSRKRWNIWIFECYLRLYFQVSLKQIKRLEIRFLNSTYFHTLSDCVRTVFQAWYVFMRESEFVMKLPVFQIKKKKKMFIFMEKICVSISAGNTVSKCKISLGILMQIFNRFLMRV